MAWWKIIRRRRGKRKRPPGSGVWRKHGGYSGSGDGSTFAPPIEWEKK